MRLCYQVATPDVAIADSVTAYQGPLEKSFSDLAKLGYKGVELMTLNPSELDWDFVKSEAEKNGLKVVLVCTGERAVIDIKLHGDGRLRNLLERYGNRIFRCTDRISDVDICDTGDCYDRSDLCFCDIYFI